MSSEHTRSAFVTDEGFLAALYSGEFIYCVRDYFTCAARPHHTVANLEPHLPPFRVLRGVEAGYRLDLLLRGDDWWANLAITEESISAEFGAMTLDRGQEIAKAFHDGLATKKEPEPVVHFEVWAGKEFPNSGSFKDVTWDSVRDNYPQPTQLALWSCHGLMDT